MDLLIFVLVALGVGVFIVYKKRPDVFNKVKDKVMNLVNKVNK